jgi:hypothetical protein
MLFDIFFHPFPGWRLSAVSSTPRNAAAAVSGNPPARRPRSRWNAGRPRCRWRSAWIGRCLGGHGGSVGVFENRGTMYPQTIQNRILAIPSRNSLEMWTVAGYPDCSCLIIMFRMCILLFPTHRSPVVRHCFP